MPKPNQLPWEDEPYEDPQAATERAIASAEWATPGHQTTTAQRNYAEKAFRREIADLEAQTRGTRNHTLNKAAYNLAQLVAAGALDEREVRQALFDACRENGHIDDGERMVLGTIESGFEAGLRQPRDLSHVANCSAVLPSDDEPKTRSTLSIPDIESGFWTKRDSLQAVYLGALARMCSPWAVLAHCAARALALVRPNAVLPPLIGGPGSLNWYAAVAGKSGSTKSSSMKAARELVPDLVMTRNLGSGEGLIDAYVRPANKETGEPRGLHESIMFLVDEIDELKALLTRSGSTLSSILRSAFTAEGLGFSYRTASSQHLGAGTYRLTLVANVQPARAGALLDDPHGGMLQRFMWFPSTDPRLTFDTPLMPTPLTLPPHSAWQYPRELKVPYIVKHLIKDTHLKSNRGEESPLNSHALFAREKFAFALAVLDGRDEMTEEDWRLAGVASRVSEHTREWVIQEWESATEAESVREGKKNGQKQFAANQERSHQERVLRNSRRQQIIEKIAACGHAGLTRDELLHKFHSRYRDMLGPLFDGMVEDGILVRNSQDERRYVMADEDES